MTSPRGPEAHLRVEVTPRLGTHAAEWDAFVAAGGHRTPFLRAWWLDGIATDRSRFLLVHDAEGCLVGGVALEYRRWPLPELRMAGADMGAADLDLVAAPGLEAAVGGAVHAWVTGSPLPRRLHLSGLRADAALLPAVVPGGTTWVEGHAHHQALPATFEDYLQARSRNFRKSVNRARRHVLEQSGGTHRWFDDGSLDRGLAALDSLHDRLHGESSVLSGHLDRLERAIRAGATTGHARLHGIEVDGRIVAVDVVFVGAGTLAVYNGGRDPDLPAADGAGTVLLAAAIEHACGHGLDRFDLLRGDDTYKQRWVDDSREVVAVIDHHGATARAAERLRPALREALQRARGLADAARR